MRATYVEVSDDTVLTTPIESAAVADIGAATRCRGARSQLSSMTVAVLALLTLLFLTGLFEKLPEATLAAIVIAAVAEPDGEPPLYPTVAAALDASREGRQRPFTGNG